MGPIVLARRIPLSEGSPAHAQTTHTEVKSTEKMTVFKFYPPYFRQIRRNAAFEEYTFLFLQIQLKRKDW
jgi:hypothetical protein